MGDIVKYEMKANGFFEYDCSDEERLDHITFGGGEHGSLFWNDETGIIVYVPNKGFEGKDEFWYSFDYDGTDDTVTTVEMEVVKDLFFRPRARLVKIIGQELISNDIIALVELVKNSYDAEAKNVTIQFNDIDKEEGEILVLDDGCGMSENKIKNVWLEPATPDRRSNKEGEILYSPCFGRRYLGEKGIGRFAAHRLGDKIQMVTRASEDCSKKVLKYETQVEVDWTKFSAEEYLDNIPVTVNTSPKPVIFNRYSGTSIKITSIHPWKEDAVLQAVTKLRSLESPLTADQDDEEESANSLKDPGFDIAIESNNKALNKKINKIKPIGELVDTAFYKFIGRIDANGKISYRYEFDRPDCQNIKRIPKEDEFTKVDLRTTYPEVFEKGELDLQTTPGEFKVMFYAWDLEKPALKIAGLAQLHKEIIAPNSGVRIYRDKFRVWPYGEASDDWLEMDIKRLNRPRERSVSRNQIVGFIEISSKRNPKLQDQSNREGIIDSPQYRNFYNLVQASLSLFASERKKDKIKMDKVATTRKLEDSVTLAIRKLEKNVKKNKHTALYKDDINEVEKNYLTKINDVLERYMMAAAIGISYSIPIHEMRLRLTSIKDIIEDIQENPSLQDKYLRELIKIVNDTEDIVKAVSSIMSRQKRQKVNLTKVGSNSFKLKESELRKHEIEYEIKGDGKLEVDAVPGLLNTAVLNLVDNSIYWLRSQKLRMKNEGKSYKPKITIEIGKDKEKTFLRVKDNGAGLEDPFDLLVEPYYSRKTDGLGLGLFLVKEIMMRMTGEVVGYNKEGAVIELIFNK